MSFNRFDECYPHTVMESIDARAILQGCEREPSFWVKTINGEQASENFNLHTVRVRKYKDCNLASMPRKQRIFLNEDGQVQAPEQATKKVEPS